MTNELVATPVINTSQQTKKLERGTIITLLFGAVLLIIIRVFINDIYFIYDAEHFLTIHTSLELISIALNISLAVYGFLAFPHNLSRYRLFLSSLFLAIALLDIYHTLSYYGMPRFITENTQQKPTWFWVFARFTEYSFLLAIFLVKDKSISIKYRRLFLFLPIIYAHMVALFVLAFESKLPLLIEPGVGVTDVKKGIEYVNALVSGVILLVVYRKYKEEQDLNYLYLIRAFGFFFLMQIIFTVYRDVYDFDNFLGHLYKVIGGYYLLKGIYLSMIEEPYLKRFAAEESLRKHQQQLTSRVLEAQEEERKRISRELHDRVGQELYSVSVGIKLFEMEMAEYDTNITGKLDNIKKMLNSSMEEVKSIALSLRPSTLDYLGLIPTLKAHIEKYEALYGIKVNLLDESYRRQDPRIETAFYRIIVEALLNSAKYAMASQITIELVLSPTDVTLQITDDGIGFDLHDTLTAGAGIGLYSMRERMQQIDGVIYFDSQFGRGTIMHASVRL